MLWGHRIACPELLISEFLRVVRISFLYPLIAVGVRAQRLERSTIVGAGAGWATGVSSESAGLLRALLVELRDLGSLTHSLEIDSGHSALVVVGGGTVLGRGGGGSVLAGRGTVLAGRGAWVATAAASLRSRVLALLAQQNLTDLLQQLRIDVLSLRALRADAHHLVSTAAAATRAERGRSSLGVSTSGRVSTASTATGREATTTSAGREATRGESTGRATTSRWSVVIIARWGLCDHSGGQREG